MKKINTWLITAQLVVLIILVFQIRTLASKLDGLKLSTGEVVAPTQPTAQAPTPRAPTPTVNMDQIADDDPYKGDKNAPVVIVEFSDFECPFCARFYRDTLPQIIDNYVNTGKVKFVYRDFPLTSIHRNAQKAAESAECAEEQGKFWEMHDKIFDNQGTLSVDNYKAWAVELGLNTESFNNCLDSGKMASEVQKDLSDGSAAGIRGTPGFIINGQLVSGAQPYAAFQQIIEAELNK